jgi:hypothetical protein
VIEKDTRETSVVPVFVIVMTLLGYCLFRYCFPKVMAVGVTEMEVVAPERMERDKKKTANVNFDDRDMSALPNMVNSGCSVHAA